VKSSLPALLAAVICGTALAHPVPDIPVRTVFNSDGTATIRVEVDPRCFAQDPLNEPYLENAKLQTYTEEQRTELLDRARKLILDTIEFSLLPGGTVQPEFRLKFTSFANQALSWNVEKPAENTEECAVMPVMVTAEWSVDASKANGYRIRALKAGRFSVQYINHIGGEEHRLQVLFPGETSYVLELRN
jgi:hypothetical protein